MRKLFKHPGLSCALCSLLVASWLGRGFIIIPVSQRGEAPGIAVRAKPAMTHPDKLGAVARTHIAKGLERLPLRFEPNGGIGSEAGFSCRAAGCDVLLTKQAQYITSTTDATEGYEPLRISFLGARPQSTLEGDGLLGSTSNYFSGRDPGKWRTGVANYSAVRYKELYAGIDARYYGRGNQLEVDFEVSPGADPSAISFGVSGDTRTALNDQGDLVVGVGPRTLVFLRPSIYQETNRAREEVRGEYAIEGHRIGFRVAEYDHRSKLVIDPVLDYSTYIGGTSPSDDTDATGVAIDPSGGIYLTGNTDATDFPVTPGAFQTTPLNEAEAAYVTKLNPEGTELIYSTYIQSQSQSRSLTLSAGIAVDATGCAILAGVTEATDFPTTPGAFQSVSAGGLKTFVLKLNPTGSGLIYSTLLGGSSRDFCFSLAVDRSGLVCVVGQTNSEDFPVTANAIMSRKVNPLSTGFVTKLAADGANLVYSTYLGGSGVDDASGAATDILGNIYVGGSTSSPDFPTTPGAFQRENKGESSGFVTKFSPSGELVYSTLIGGKRRNGAGSIAVNDSGELYLAGASNSRDFPTTPGCYQPRLAGDVDIIVAKLDTAGHSLLFSTFLGGRDSETVGALALDHEGSMYVAGASQSDDYPVTRDAIQKANRGGYDVVVSKLSPDGSKLIYSTYLGGRDDDFGSAIVLDSEANAFVVGETDSSRFPTTRDALLARSDAISGFLAKIQSSDFTLNLSPQQAIVSPGDNLTVEIAIERKGGLIGPVGITPPNASAHKIRISPSGAVSIRSGTLSFRVKVKAAASPGQYLLVFSATDSRGVLHHTATFTLNVQ